jgi:hypothetical protein
MKVPSVRVYSLHDPDQKKNAQEYWQGQSYEARLDAVEKLRRQFGKLHIPGKPHGSVERLRRVLRIVQ